MDCSLSHLHVRLVKIPRNVIDSVPPLLLDREWKGKVHERIECDGHLQERQ